MIIDNFTDLEWDTKFFNFKVAKVENYIITQNELNFLKKNGYSLIYLFLKNKENINKLPENSVFVDEKITYKKKISEKSNIDVNIKKYELEFPENDLIDLAIESGIYSRFNIDNNIEKNKFQELYKQWITNSVNHKIAKEVFVYKINNKIAGMITLSEKNKRGDIGIIAVNKNYRKQKIASKLIDAAETYFLSCNYTDIQVITQRNNIPACTLYEKVGFTIDKIEYVYHIWLK